MNIKVSIPWNRVISVICCGKRQGHRCRCVSIPWNRVISVIFESCLKEFIEVGFNPLESGHFCNKPFFANTKCIIVSIPWNRVISVIRSDADNELKKLHKKGGVFMVSIPWNRVISVIKAQVEVKYPAIVFQSPGIGSFL